jgi:hypothetical protein
MGCLCNGLTVLAATSSASVSDKGPLHDCQVRARRYKTCPAASLECSKPCSSRFPDHSLDHRKVHVSDRHRQGCRRWPVGAILRLWA